MARVKKSKTAQQAGKRIAQTNRPKPKAAKPPHRYTGPQRTENGELIGPPPPPKGGQGGAPPPGGEGEPPPNDLNIPGLPPEVAARVHQIFVSGKDNWEQEAITYLMGTSWFKAEYAGYDVGYSKSLFADPLSGGLAQYRAYKNDVNRLHLQYYGTAATQTDLLGYINSGYDTGMVEKAGQGYTTVQANQADWNYLTGAFGGGQLTDAEKKAYGEELAGIDTALGQSIKNKVEAAMNRMQGVFQGRVGSSALGDQSLGQRITRKPDIQA